MSLLSCARSLEVKRALSSVVLLPTLRRMAPSALLALATSEVAAPRPAKGGSGGTVPAVQLLVRLALDEDAQRAPAACLAATISFGALEARLRARLRARSRARDGAGLSPRFDWRVARQGRLPQPT